MLQMHNDDILYYSDGCNSLFKLRIQLTLYQPEIINDGVNRGEVVLYYYTHRYDYIFSLVNNHLIFNYYYFHYDYLGVT